MWTALGIQGLGVVIEAAWHGALHSDGEEAAGRDVVTHLLSVHAVFFVGVLALLVGTGWTLMHRGQRSEGVLSMAVAFAGSIVQTAGQAWDIYGHLHRTTGGPIAWTMIAAGPLIAATALLLGGRRRRPIAPLRGGGEPGDTPRLHRRPWRAGTERGAVR